MERFSFLNAAHTSYFADLYEQYLQNPDSVEPSWRAFFQGFDFGQNGISEATVNSRSNGENATSAGEQENFVSADMDDFCEPQLQNLQKEFQVINLIEGYRSRGHLFTQTNPVRDR